MTSLFEKMMQSFSKKDTAQLLGTCMEFDAGKMKRIPLRYRLIAMGFVTQMTLEELEARLERTGTAMRAEGRTERASGCMVSGSDRYLCAVEKLCAAKFRPAGRTAENAESNQTAPETD